MSNRPIFYLESVHKADYFVIPAEAGIQNRLKSLDSRFHGNDGKAIYKQTLFSKIDRNFLGTKY